MRLLDDVIRAIPGEHFHLGGDEVEGLAHEDYVQFMWDACSLVLEHGKTPDRVGGGRRGEAAQGHGRPALVGRQARAGRRRAGPAADHVAGAAHLPRPEVRRGAPSSG